MGCGSFFGLRISDLLSLTWKDILSSETFTIKEKKTGKIRTIKINKNFQGHIRDCYNALNSPDTDEFAFISHKNTVYSTQRINVILKEVKSKYGLKIAHFSSHSLRKTFGRRVVDMAGANSEMALIKLSELFNHSSTMITRRYLGLRQQELLETYDMLEY